MKKTLSAKVDAELYDLVDNLPNNHSYYIRLALEEFFEKHWGFVRKDKERGIPLVYHQSEGVRDKDIDDDQLKGIHTKIDSLKRLKNDDIE